MFSRHFLSNPRRLELRQKWRQHLIANDRIAFFAPQHPDRIGHTYVNQSFPDANQSFPDAR